MVQFEQLQLVCIAGYCLHFSFNESIKDDWLCVGPVKLFLVGDMFRLCDAQHPSVAPSFKDVYHVLH